MLHSLTLPAVKYFFHLEHPYNLHYIHYEVLKMQVINSCMSRLLSSFYHRYPTHGAYI